MYRQTRLAQLEVGRVEEFLDRNGPKKRFLYNTNEVTLPGQIKIKKILFKIQQSGLPDIW